MREKEAKKRRIKDLENQRDEEEAYQNRLILSSSKYDKENDASGVQRYEKLYKDRENSKMRKKRLVEKVNEQDGCSFAPKVNNEKNRLMVKASLEERNDQLLVRRERSKNRAEQEIMKDSTFHPKILYPEPKMDET